MKKLFAIILLLIPSLCFGADLLPTAMDLLPFPPDCDTPGEKVCYSYRTQDRLRHEHNVMSYWLHCGLTQDEYDNGLVAICKKNQDLCCGVDELTVLGPKLKADFPYKEFITEDDYWRYWDDWFKPRQSRVGSECLKNKEACLKDPYCQSNYFKLVDGPDGMELNFDKAHEDIANISSIYPIKVDDIPRAEVVQIDK